MYKTISFVDCFTSWEQNFFQHPCRTHFKLTVACSYECI